MGQEQTGEVVAERCEDHRHDGGEDDDGIGAQKGGGESVLRKTAGPRHPHVIDRRFGFLLRPEHGQDGKPEYQQSGDERKASQCVVVQLEFRGAVEAHPDKGEVHGDIEKWQARSLGQKQTSIERSGSCRRPTEVNLREAARREDLTDGLEESSNDGKLDEGSGRGDPVGGVSDSFDQHPCEVQSQRKRRGQETAGNDCANGETQIVAVRA